MTEKYKRTNKHPQGGAPAGKPERLKPPDGVFSTNDIRRHRAMGLFVNPAAAGGFTMQSGPGTGWTTPGWTLILLILCGPYSSFLLPTDCLNGSSCAPMCACVSVGVCGWVGTEALFPLQLLPLFPLCGTQLVSVGAGAGPFPLSEPQGT